MEILILGLLLVLGIILILIETLFIPGTTIFGILGIISIFSSDYLSYVYFGTEFAIIYSNRVNGSHFSFDGKFGSFS